MPLHSKMMIVGCFIAAFCFGQQSPGIHLHFDKDIYLPGEKIWFKAYFYNDGAAVRSTNFYTAIYGEDGKLLQQKLYPVIEACSNGNYTIPDTTQPGKIQFIAFTKDMITGDSTNLFRKIISVYKKADQVQDSTVAVNNINLQFLPEGGNWVAGINGFMAFKAWNNDGSAAQVKGVIVDEETHAVIDSFVTNKLGMGSLQLMPEQKKYTAIWKDADGKTIKTALPEVNSSGAVLHVEQRGNEFYYLVNKRGSGKELRTLHLLAQRDEQEIYKADILIEDKTAVIDKFPVDQLSAGIIQLTLFDKSWHPLQQRIVFLNAPNKKISVNQIEKNLLPKSKNIIELALQDTFLTNLSASVADINFYDKTGSYSIKQDIWFNSQLKGLTENINNEIENNDTALVDLVMMTHGWRKYNWKNIIEGKQQETTEADNYLALDFNYKEKNRAFALSERLSLVINDKTNGKQFYDLDQFSHTSFRAGGLIFYDTAKIYYRLKNNNDLLDKISVSRNNDIAVPLSIASLKTIYSSYSFLSSGYTKPLDTFSFSKKIKFNDIRTMKEVTVKGRYVNPITKRIQQLDDKYTSGSFSGITKGYQLNLLDDDGAQVDIFNYLKYRIPSKVGVYGPLGNRQLYPCSMSGNDVCDPFIIFINEVQVPGTTLEAIPFSNIAYVKFIPGIVINTTLYTSIGVVYVYTKKGDEKAPVVNSMSLLNIKGYDLPDEFFNPDYSNSTSLLQQDLRTTLYWNPYIIMNRNNNKARIEFYNNDISKKLLLTIEGINEEGELIHIEKVIE